MAVAIGVPTKVAVIFARLAKVLPDDEVSKGLDVISDEGDILLSCGPKCGSTWVQQILHGLRSGGRMDYDDINVAVPFLEYVTMSGSGENIAQSAYTPRIFKTHSLKEACPHADKIIVVTRNPNDAVLSLFYYYRNWIFESDELTLDEFIQWFFLYQTPEKVRGWNARQLHHLISWYPCRKQKNVLWLHYEDLKADLSQCIKLISEFTGLGVGDQELLKLVEQQASLEFMKKHADKFDSHQLKLNRNELGGLHKHAGLDKSKNPGKVRSGRVNESKEAFSPETIARMQGTWMQLARPITGFDSYEEMRTVFNAEMGRVFPE